MPQHTAFIYVMGRTKMNGTKFTKKTTGVDEYTARTQYKISWREDRRRNTTIFFRWLLRWTSPWFCQSQANSNTVCQRERRGCLQQFATSEDRPARLAPDFSYDIIGRAFPWLSSSGNLSFRNYTLDYEHKGSMYRIVHCAGFCNIRTKFSKTITASNCN